uniref:Uncharacterized protein LOC105133109 n=1 Tax=Rhizophora mucronata TaxID=61149 RepID=A0A2P2KEQ2_RHIMU
MTAKPSGDCKKQYRKAVEEEELVKYMSNLPNYLERSQSPQDKVLNFGVLDWSRLEKWQSQKNMPHGSHRHSLSSSNTSSPFSTEGSSIHSSRGRSSSPTHQRMHRPSLQFHLISSPRKGHSQVVNSFEEGVGNFLGVKGLHTNTENEKGKFIRTIQPFPENHSVTKLVQQKTKNSDPGIESRIGSMVDGVNCEAPQYVKVKMQTLDIELTDRAEKFQELEAHTVDQNVSQEGEPVVLMPRNIPKSGHSGVPQFSKSTAIGVPMAARSSGMSCAEMSKEVELVGFCSNTPYSCPPPQKSDTKIKQCTDAGNVNSLPESSHRAEHPAKVGIVPSCHRVSQVKQSTMAAATSTSKQSSMRLDQNWNKVAGEKARSTSPFRRLSIGMGKIGKSFVSKDGLSTLPSNLSNDCAKFGLQDARNSFCQDASAGDSQNNTSRARSSPLRRLLDPLWKPKAPLQKDFTLAYKACKSSDGKTDSSIETAEPGMVKTDLTSCQATNASDPLQCKTSASSPFQALLRVAVKNGQPLYTFAVDNKTDILAATMKKLNTSREDDYSCIYTFFSIQEVKKKNGRWINQGGKGRGQDYISNVVAQLKVSGSQFLSLTGQKHMEQSFAREFVLFAVDLQQAERQTLNFQPDDELAAIVVKIPRVINRSTLRDGHQSHKFNDLPQTKFHSTWENIPNQPYVGFQSLINATVILPSGIHSLPSKGGPSSLIQRWRSGGSCDCEGWDLGCKLRILSNQSQLIKKSIPSKGRPMMEKFEFVFQGGEGNQPVFSLVPFKDGIYSVEFSSLLSILQAFSLCIAVIDSKKLGELPESSNLFEERPSLGTMLSQSDGTRAPNGTDKEINPRYVSHPPLSPAGRV